MLVGLETVSRRDIRDRDHIPVEGHGAGMGRWVLDSPSASANGARGIDANRIRKFSKYLHCALPVMHGDCSSQTYPAKIKNQCHPGLRMPTSLICVNQMGSE
jgi:hypothetical protein